MADIADLARQFFAAVDTGQGWDKCAPYCTPDATFSAQAEPLVEIKTLAAYAEWMKGLMTILPDGHYEIRSFAIDEAKRNVSVYGVFAGTHTGDGGPCPPTGKSVSTDYVYVMDFTGDKIHHMTKIWNAGWALKALGWG